LPNFGITRDNEPLVCVNPAQELSDEARLREALAEVIKDEVLDNWLQRPNKQFDGSTPLQVIERGETARVWQMIWQLRDGNSG
jgi:hypothetical protein